MQPERTVAYFSMEIGLEPGAATYAGGLGVLAGDSIRSAADMRAPLVAVSLLHRKGYFRQRLDASGRQAEEPERWATDDFARLEPARAHVTIEGRRVEIAAWRHTVRGSGGGGFEVPVYLLDTDLSQNSEQDRRITDVLYGGDEKYRLAQEIVLGIGGVRMLAALGHTGIRRYHMNEGHAALLVLELLRREREAQGAGADARSLIEAVRRRCIFTTHTPVPAGHDKFPIDLAAAMIEPGLLDRGAPPPLREAIFWEDRLNLTHLGLTFSGYINGVSERHGEVSRRMFAGHAIDSITNGVHAATWTSPPIRGLLDRHIPGWREDNFSLRHARGIPLAEIAAAHGEAKERLVRIASARGNAGFDGDVLTIGYARRATAYKRPDLLLSDVERLRRIAREAGTIQVVYAGKAHPRDGAGKDLIVKVHEAIRALREGGGGGAAGVRMVYLENYDMELAQVMTAGVDLWLNTPQPPMEASGTSGMKAAMNAVPSLSVLDGWWVEGCIEGVTGWAIGEGSPTAQTSVGGTDDGESVKEDRSGDAASLYEKLERVIVPLYYKEREKYLAVMRHALSINGSFFNTQRMVQEYVVKAYFD